MQTTSKVQKMKISTFEIASIEGGSSTKFVPTSALKKDSSHSQQTVMAKASKATLEDLI
jgi:hypothetical protein